MTARDLITDILQDLNVVGAEETPSDADAHFVLRRMNRWIESLALENLTLHHVVRTLQTLAASTASYTIGTGGTINVARPIEIQHAGLIIDTAATPKTEIPIRVFTDQEWQGIVQKDLTSSLAQGIYYDRGSVAGLGRIYPWPIPTVGTTQLALYALLQLTQFADLNTTYTLPTGYELFFETNVLTLIAKSFGKAVSEDQKIAARDAKTKLKRSNIRPVRIGVDAALLHNHSTFDWRTGESR